MLRTQTSGATLRAIKGRRPPVRLLCAGRVYRPVEEDENHMKVFHQLDAICVAMSASMAELQATLARLLSTVLGSIEISYRKEDLGFVDHGMQVYCPFVDESRGVAGCGMLKPAMLREAGHDPDQVQGYAFGFGLERLAQLKLVPEERSRTVAPAIPSTPALIVAGALGTIEAAEGLAGQAGLDFQDHALGYRDRGDVLEDVTVGLDSGSRRLRRRR